MNFAFVKTCLIDASPCSTVFKFNRAAQRPGYMRCLRRRIERCHEIIGVTIKQKRILICLLDRDRRRRRVTKNASALLIFVPKPSGSNCGSGSRRYILNRLEIWRGQFRVEFSRQREKVSGGPRGRIGCDVVTNEG